MLSQLVRLIAWLFYRVDRAGPLPPPGAVLILPNHPNSLLDPAIVWATSGRRVRFLAKSTLFDGPLRPILSACGAIPVYRRIDQGVDTSQNAQTFADVGAVLAQGGAVCLFPEGISHSSGRLEPLRTGAARMALAAEQEGTRVALVPVGLNFERKAVFRSRVTVVYGEAFSCADLLGTRGPDDPGAVREATERIAAHIRGLLVEADPDAGARLVERVDRLYTAARGAAATPQERIERRRLIAAGIERLRTLDPQRYDDTWLRIRRYDERLKRFGLRDRHLDWQTSGADALRFALRELLVALFLVPLCAAGFALFFVPYHATGWISRRITKQPDIVATAQVIGGVVMYGVWLALLAGVAWWMAGPRAAGAAVVLAMGIAFAALFAIERESAVLDAVRAWFLLRRASPRARAGLRRRRSELADVLDDVHTWLSASRV